MPTSPLSLPFFQTRTPATQRASATVRFSRRAFRALVNASLFANAPSTLAHARCSTFRGGSMPVIRRSVPVTLALPSRLALIPTRRFIHDISHSHPAPALSFHGLCASLSSAPSPSIPIRPLARIAGSCATLVACARSQSVRRARW
ncbi:hypothetical protein TRVL_06671 [Trypanosoma vivax]|nr:hypothetical protein TRVL_06671 [Trypanosoma vivax]